MQNCPADFKARGLAETETDDGEPNTPVGFYGYDASFQPGKFQSSICAAVASVTDATTTMPQGDKSSYTAKQKRQASHIEKGYEKRGVGEKEAEERAWRTVNKQTGGGKKKSSVKKSAKKKSTKRKPTKKTAKKK